MSVSVVITNLTASAVKINELYVSLGAAGSSTASVTVERSVAQLDSMSELKSLLDAGTVSVSATQSASNEDILSIALEQHGVVAGVSVNAVAVVTATVTFAKPFPAGVVPVVTLTIDKTDGPAARGTAWVQAVTNAGFDYYYDVTTADAGLTNDLNWVATY